MSKNKFLNDALSSSGIAWWKMYVKDGKVEFSELKTEMLGYHYENFSHYSDFTNLIHPDDYEKAMQSMRDLLEGKSDTYFVDYRIKNSEEQYVWFRDVGKLSESGKDGKYIIGTVTNINEDKRREEKRISELNAMKSQLEMFAENSTDGFIVFDYFNIIYASPSFLNLFGYSNFDEIPKTPDEIANVVHPNDIERTFGVIYDAIDNKKDSLKYNYRFKHKNGDYIWREDHSRFIYDKDGNYIKAYVICRDITETKKYIKKLSLYETAINQTPTTLVITDTNGVIEYVNPRFSALTGYKSDEAIGKNPSILKSGYHNEEFYENLWDAVSSGNVWHGEFLNLKKDGEKYWEKAWISPVVNETGNITNYIKIGEDITDEKELQKKLKDNNDRLLELNDVLRNRNLDLDASRKKIAESEKKKDAILKAMPDMMFMFDKKGNFIDFHTNNDIYLFSKPEDFLYKNVIEVLPENLAELTSEKIQIVLKFKQTVNYKYTSKLFDIERTFDSRMVYIDDEHTLAIVRDITDWVDMNKNLEEALEKARQSDKMKEAFLNNLSHEIRTPLNGIIGFAQLVSEISDNPEIKQYYDIMISSSNRLISTIENLVDISKILSGQYIVNLKKLNMRNLFLTVYDEFLPKAEEKSLDLIFENIEDAEDLIITSDEDIITKMLHSVLDNAIKFTNLGHINFGYSVYESTLAIYVNDTGIGISDDKIDSIFNVFEQIKSDKNREFDGNGIGLSIVNGLSELLGGAVNISSKEQEGTSLYIHLPIFDKLPNI